MLKVLYLTPNLADPAAARRISMMRAGGATVAVAGFIRKGAALPSLDASDVVTLGETFDGRFAQRLVAVARALATVVRTLGNRDIPDVIMARNLEMLPLANRLRAVWGGRHPIVYECLDIHRLLLRQDMIGRSMRAAERYLSAPAALLTTSSPGFLRNYFDIYGGPPALIVENKAPIGNGDRGRNPALDNPEGPLRIGWFGALRCSRSLDALSRLTADMDGKIEVVLRGRPALTEFDDFHAKTAAQPGLHFAGPYRNPDDLTTIYSDVHFSWAIDFFEAGQNSSWLLPNRLYEGCLHGAIPIAVAGTETAAFLDRHGIGLIVPDIEPATLRGALGGLDAATIHLMAGRVAALDPSLFSYGEADCRALVSRISSLRADDNLVTEVA
jgi:succinoglycan biosynthesis protein ExoL